MGVIGGGGPHHHHAPHCTQPHDAHVSQLQGVVYTHVHHTSLQTSPAPCFCVWCAEMALLVALVLSLHLIPIVCSIQILSHPQDISVPVGGIAYFNCTYSGTLAVPFWIIRERVFSIQNLPERHSYSDQALIVENVQESDNGSTYRCSFFDIQSATATLTVLVFTNGRHQCSGGRVL